ncbi:MAG: PQQ-dependent sugar dehydrogenase [Bacteroidota bacterium]
MKAFLLRRLERTSLKWKWSILGLCLMSLAFAPLLSPPPNTGLSSPTAIGAYLNGSMPNSPPAETPSVSYGTELIFDGIDFFSPVNMIKHPQQDKFFVSEKRGRIILFDNDSLVSDTVCVLNIDGQTSQGGGTNGLTGFILHPEFGIPGSPNRGYFYVFYRYIPDSNLLASEGVGYRRLSRFTIPDGSNIADPNSELILIQQFAQSRIHSAGGMFFDEDGLLYVGLGDEGTCCEQQSTQALDKWLFAGVIRIDVDNDSSRSHPIRRQPIHNGSPPAGWPGSFSANYLIPNDNPWLDSTGAYLEEFYAIGIRHAYTLSYDSLSGLIFEGDIGEGRREEINKIEKGGNYQWPFYEGDLVKSNGLPPSPANLASAPGVSKDPFVTFNRASSQAIIGGFVYRGNKYPNLQGKYLFADHKTCAIWAIDATATGPFNQDSLTQIAQIPGCSQQNGLASFGTDEDGEIYMLKMNGVSPGGKVYRLSATILSGAEPPALLSQTGAFANLANLTPASGVIPYAGNSPLWSDGAEKQRWIALPNDGTHDLASEQIGFAAEGDWTFPEGTVFIKHFELPNDAQNPSQRLRLETRFIVMSSNDSYYGVTYRWRADGSDADLLTTSDTLDVAMTNLQGQAFNQPWVFPSRTECLSCHTEGGGRALGVNTHQLNGSFLYPSTAIKANQLHTWNTLGMFDTDIGDVADYLVAAEIGRDSTTLEHQIRSYLEANCSHCHHPSGVEGAFDARFSTPLSQQGLIDENVQGPNSDPNNKIVVAGNPSLSELWVRDTSLSSIAMPPLAKQLVDNPYVDSLQAWIMSMDKISLGFSPIGEVGEVAITDVWTTVNLSQSYIDAVVIAGVPSFNGSQPTTVRVRNVSASSFEIRLDEWECLDETHLVENVPYLVVEAGSHTLPNGIALMAGNQSGITTAWDTISFPQSLNQSPAVFTQVVTENEASAITVRINDLQSNNLQVAIKLDEAENEDNIHQAETLSWLALAEGKYSKAGAFEVGKMSGLDHRWQRIPFAQVHAYKPLLFAQTASYNEVDPGALRYNQASQTGAGIELFFEEEGCGDSDTTHAPEEINYAVFERADILYALPNVTFPIELIDFRARVVETKVEIQWELASEQNVSHFEIEKSHDGLSFALLNQVKSQGNSLQSSIYQTWDPAPDYGWNYYRLKTIDHDGSVAYSEIERVSYNANEPQIKVYPNPLGQQQMLFVEMKVPEEEFIGLEIYNLAAKLLHKETAKGSSTGTLVRIPAHNFGPGVYFIKFNSANWDATRRFIIQAE